jgi:hypothetical protein
MFVATSTRAIRGRNLGLLGLLLIALLATGCLSSPQQGNTGLQTLPTATIGSSGAQVNGLGAFVTAKSIGTGNAPQNVTSTFNSTDTVYAVVQVQQFAQGNRVFARWSVNGSVREDTQEITADRDYSNTYLEFHIQGTNGAALPTGNWTVQLFVNSNPGPIASFQVQ